MLPDDDDTNDWCDEHDAPQYVVELVGRIAAVAVATITSAVLSGRGRERGERVATPWCPSGCSRVAVPRR